jgi:hypothetical protein
MSISILRLLASVLLLALIVSTSAAAESKLEMHRVGVNVDDGSGWYSAVSTKGSFSILLPIPCSLPGGSTPEKNQIVGLFQADKGKPGLRRTARRLPAKVPDRAP